MPALCLAVVTYVGCQTALAVFLLTIATGAIGSMYSGYLSNHISIAPAFAGQCTLVGYMGGEGGLVVLAQTRHRIFSVNCLRDGLMKDRSPVHI